MYEPYFHVGILVRDVEAARADFTAKLGVEFEPVHSQQIATGETTRFCYSLQGPPYLELVEMTGTGSWSPEQPEGFHHLGLSDLSVPARCTAFGDGADLIAPGKDGSPLVALTPSEALHGVRVEYFDATVAAQFLGYLRGRTARLTELYDLGEVAEPGPCVDVAEPISPLSPNCFQCRRGFWGPLALAGGPVALDSPAWCADD